MSDLYKILIVDDEFFICDGLMSFHWKELGFEAVSYAYNGEEALEKLEKELIDVIITDIKMPFMDGIELIERVSSQFPKIKLILLTGYKEFEYARAAMKSGVSEYLLKPVDLNELTTLFVNLKKKLDEESQIPNMLKTYKKLINENLPLVAEKFLKDIYEAENLLIDSLMIGNSEISLSHFDELWKKISPDLKSIDSEPVKDYAIQLLNMIDRRLNKHGTTLRECIQVPPPFTSFVSSINSFTALGQSMKDVISKICEVTNKINHKVHSSSYLSIETAKNYMNNNYTKRITLNQVADIVFLNPSYFSIQFKKEAGLNFVDYLKNLRINKAKELLKRFDLKIYEIGNMVGYEDATYFANTFKSCTGITPLEYRRRLT